MLAGVARGKDPQRELGWAIRKLRFDADLTQRTLAERVELDPSRISRIENGKDNPQWGTVRKVAGGLGVSLAKLAALAEDFERRGSDR